MNVNKSKPQSLKGYLVIAENLVGGSDSWMRAGVNEASWSAVVTPNSLFTTESMKFVLITTWYNHAKINLPDFQTAVSWWVAIRFARVSSACCALCWSSCRASVTSEWAFLTLWLHTNVTKCKQKRNIKNSTWWSPKICLMAVHDECSQLIETQALLKCSHPTQRSLLSACQL